MECRLEGSFCSSQSHSVTLEDTAPNDVVVHYRPPLLYAQWTADLLVRVTGQMRWCAERTLRGYRTVLPIP